MFKRCLNDIYSKQPRFRANKGVVYLELGSPQQVTQAHAMWGKQNCSGFELESLDYQSNLATVNHTAMDLAC